MATRPAAHNGLGLTLAQADANLARFTSWFAVLPDDPRILPQWRQVVVQHQVIGKNGHDARLVAAMLVHGIDQLLTLWRKLQRRSAAKSGWLTSIDWLKRSRSKLFVSAELASVVRTISR